MGEMLINLPNESFKVKIKGDKPTIEEQLKLNDLVAERRRLARRSSSEQSAAAQQEQLFDTSSGIKDAKLRALLSTAETAEEEEAQLQKLYGLGEGDYARDNRGRLAITKQGGTKLGMELEKDTLVDEEGFSRYDFADLAGIVPDIVGGVGGTLGGAALGTALLPGIGTFIGGVLGAGFGTAAAGGVEEGVEALAGVSRQTAGEIATDLKNDFLIGAGSELFIGGAIRIVAPFFRGMRGRKLEGQDLETAGISLTPIEEGGFGIQPALGNVGGSSLLARQQAMGEKVAGGATKRLRENFNSMQTAIGRYKQAVGADASAPISASSAEEAGEAIISSVKSQSDKIRFAEEAAKKAVIQEFKTLTDGIGAAAVKNQNLDQSIFKDLTVALKNFDDLNATKFGSIDAVIKNAVGDTPIVTIGGPKGLKEHAKTLQSRYKAAIAAGGVSQKTASEAVAASSIIDGFQALPDKASFTQLYNLRRELFDASFTFKGRGGGAQLDEAVNLLDNVMSKETIEQGIKGLDIDAQSYNLLMKAADELPAARGFYRDGKTAIENMQAAASISGLSEAVQTGTILPKTDFLKNIVVNGKPEALTRTLKVIKMNTLKGQDGKALSEAFRKKLSSEWLADAVAKTTSKGTDPLAFKGSSFSQAIDDLGSTGKVLFGDSYDDVVKLADEIRLTTIPGKTSTVDVDSALTTLGANNAPIPLVEALEGIASAQKQTLEFNQSRLLKSIANNEAMPAKEAAQYVAAPGAKTADIVKVMNYLDPAAQQQVRQFYLSNLLDDFGSDALIKGDALKKFANSLLRASEGGKLQAVFGKEMGDDVAQFGRVLELNARTVAGGDLVAANIAANPLENIMDILRLSVTGNLLTHAPIYKRILKDYKALKSGLPPKERSAALGKIIGSALTQAPGQALQEGAREAEKQIRAVADNSGLTAQLSAIQSQMNQPNAASSLGGVNVTQPAAPAGTSTIRQQAAANPGVAQALGIRGPTAGLLGTGNP
jgi:hypothetical protein